jgi:serine/threonine-protein kinase
MDEDIAGRYRLVDRIGSGGMAEVWRAHDLDTGETVAVKRLHPHLASDGDARARFRREIDAATSVRHPLAVPIRDSGDDDSGPWLVMEHVPGGSLSARLQQGPVPESEAVPVAADVAEVLAALHAAGIVHRDVTPSNILLGADGRARLADFGIARPYDGSGLEDVTATGDVVGTLRFLAPEVLAGRPASPASDVWSLGTVLFEMLAGTSPFDASSPAALLGSQAKPVPPLPPVDASVEEALRAMLSPRPEARPTAAEAAGSLARGRPVSPLDDDPTVVMPAVPSSPRRPRRTPGVGLRPVRVVRPRGTAVRRTGPVLAVAALLLFAAIVLAAATLGGDGGTRATGTADLLRPAGAASPAPTVTPSPPVADENKGTSDAKGKSRGKGNPGGKGKSRGKDN